MEHSNSWYVSSPQVHRLNCLTGFGIEPYLCIPSLSPRAEDDFRLMERHDGDYRLGGGVAAGRSHYLGVLSKYFTMST